MVCSCSRQFDNRKVLLAQLKNSKESVQRMIISNTMLQYYSQYTPLLQIIEGDSEYQNIIIQHMDISEPLVS